MFLSLVLTGLQLTNKQTVNKKIEVIKCFICLRLGVYIIILYSADWFVYDLAQDDFFDKFFF